MKQHVRAVATALFLCLLATFSFAQAAKPGLLTPAELKQVVPSVYFFRGQSATVQVRNAGGVRVAPDKLVLVALVDTSGYSHDVQEKYEGLLITEVKLSIGGTDLVPGAYGFGFGKDGKFLVMDVASNDLLSAAFQTDENLKRPVPLKLTEEGGAYRLYDGKKWIQIKM